MIAAVRSPQTVRAAASAMVPKTAAVLPSPDLSGLAHVQDALTVLYALRVEQGNAETTAVETAMTQQKERSRTQLSRELAAMDQARQAERDANGFWAKLKSVAGTIAKVAAVVGGAAAIVATGGAAVPLAVGIAAVALSAGGTVVRDAKLFGKDSDKVAFGMEIAGAAIGLGGSVAAAVGIGAAASSSASSLASNVGTAAQLTGATATGAGATAGIRIAVFRSDGEHARANAEDARGLMAARQREIEMLARTLADAKQAEREALDTTIKAIESSYQATNVAIAGVRG